MIEFKKLDYTDFLKYEPTFLSLDISVRSTGWVKSVNGEVTWGTKTSEAEDELGRRKEFREFLISMLGETHFPVVFVEDVIAGTNFKTTKGLIQLNTIVDDLKEYGLVSVGEIKRIDNKVWKKYLKMASNYDGDIKKEDEKQLITNCMKEIGFNFRIKQDIYDAMGIAVAVIYRDKIVNEKPKVETVLKKDLKTGYTIKQFDEKDKKYEKSLQTLKEKYDREVEELDWSKESRDVLYLFKQKINKDKVDNKIYIIYVDNMKLGILALTKKLSVDNPFSSLIITKTKK
jgi:hypothetical protein